MNNMPPQKDLWDQVPQPLFMYRNKTIFWFGGSWKTGIYEWLILRYANDVRPLLLVAYFVGSVLKARCTKTCKGCVGATPTRLECVAYYA